MRTLRNLSWAFLPLLPLCACAQHDTDTADRALEVEAEIDNEAWVAELTEHRQEIDEELKTSNTSPMAGTQYLKSEPGDRLFLARQKDGFGFADSADPNVVLLVTRDGSIWHWHDQGQDVVCRVKDEIMVSGSALEGAAIFEIDGLFLSFYPSEDRVTFIVFNPDREEMQSFDHLLYFPPDRTYAVPAALEQIAEPDEIEMLTNRNLKKTFYRFAKIKFQLDGQSQELTAYKSTLTGEGSRYLFIPFRDATTGRETYGAGRFLDMEEPDEEHFVLDFNRAYNPLCNYSPAYNCAIPPRENHLEVAVRAGEMTYPH